MKKYICLSIAFLLSATVSAQGDLIFVSNLETPVLLNDTGITWGGSYPSGNNSSCTSNITAPQDCDHGRDATDNDNTDGHAGFSFTKLNASGVELSASAIGHACVRDNVTGLVWEVKTDDGQIHDKDNTYRWGGVTRQGNFGTAFYDDWDELVDFSNTQNLCGFNDWRVPVTEELLGIVNYGQNDLTNGNYFPNMQNSFYWTASPYSSFLNSAWSVNYIGRSFSGNRSLYRHVRLVRSGL